MSNLTQELLQACFLLHISSAGRISILPIATDDATILTLSTMNIAGPTKFAYD